MDDKNRNYNHMNHNRVISISDLIEVILKKIWFVIIMALVFAVLFAGYKYKSDSSMVESSENTIYSEKTEVYLSDKEMWEVNNILVLYDEAETQEEYMEQSILMNIDPYHEERVVMQFNLQPDDVDLIDVLGVLNNYIMEGPLLTDLKEFYPDEDITYFAELISFDSTFFSVDVDGLENVVYPSNTFNIQVIHSDSNECQELADRVYQSVSSFIEENRDYFGNCKMTLISEYVSQLYDSSLRSTQSTVASDQINLLNRISSQTDNLNDDQIEVLDTMLESEMSEDEAIANMTTSENTAMETDVTVHISIRYTLLGILIGIIVGIVLIAVYYVYRGTLNTAREMQGEFDIPVFGLLNVKKQKNPLVKAWRRMVNKKKAPSLEKEEKIALTTLRNFCRNQQVVRILLAGSQENLSDNIWLQEVQSTLAADGVESEIAGNLSDSPEVLKQLNEYSCVTLVETLHESIYKDVIREVEICTEMNVQILGAILFD